MSALMVNSYFDDQVKSIALENTEGSSTVRSEEHTSELQSQSQIS